MPLQTLQTQRSLQLDDNVPSPVPTFSLGTFGLDQPLVPRHLYLRSATALNTSYVANNSSAQEMVDFVAELPGARVTGSAVLDKGSTGCVISKAAFTQDELDRIVIPAISQCEGIGGTSNFIGYFFATLTIGTHRKHKAVNVRCDVIDSPTCPTLVGQNVLRAKLSKLNYDFVDNTVSFVNDEGGTSVVDFDVNPPRKTKVQCNLQSYSHVASSEPAPV